MKFLTLTAFLLTPLATVGAAETPRTWKCGEHHAEAVLMHVSNGLTHLRVENGGHTVSIPTNKLSHADQAYVRAWLREYLGLEQKTEKPRPNYDRAARARAARYRILSRHRANQAAKAAYQRAVNDSWRGYVAAMYRVPTVPRRCPID